MESQPQERRGGSVGDVLAGAGEELGAVVQDEVERLRAEVTERLESAARGSAYLAGSAILGGVAAGAVLALPLLALRRVLPAWAIATLVGGGALAAGGLLARRGLAHLSHAAPDSVAEEVESAAADVAETLRSRARAASP